MAKTKASKSKKPKELEYKFIARFSIDELVFLDDNPRRGHVKKIKASITEFGYMSPAVVRGETKEILAGNHRVKAAQSLGHVAIPAYVVTGLTNKQARKFVLADNKASDAATYNEKSLASMLEYIRGSSKGDEYLAGTGYTEKEADVIREKASWQEEVETTKVKTEKNPTENSREGREVTNTRKVEDVASRKDFVEATRRRSVSLSIPLEHHKAFIDAMKKLRKKCKVDTNEEAIVTVLVKMGLMEQVSLFDEEVTD